MKFLDLAAQYKNIKPEIDQAINDVINSSDFIMGDAVHALEEAIAHFCGTKYAVGLNSGSDALTISLKALNIGPGDEVIVPAFTYIATAEAVALVGAQPVFVDIEPDTFNIDPKKIEKAITPNTKAIIPVHLYGQAANMSAIKELATTHSLYIVEDAAQAIGAEFKGQKVGSIGDVGCFSFFPTKNLGAYGDGGMIVTNRLEVAEYIKKWRIHGQSKKYYSDFIGASSRLDTLQAAILKVKLPHLTTWTAQRQTIARKYSNEIHSSYIQTPTTIAGATHVFHQYTLRVLEGKRDTLKEKLGQQGIPTMVYYPSPLHLLSAYTAYGYVAGTFPISEQAATEVLSIPIYPELPESDQLAIIRALNS